MWQAREFYSGVEAETRKAQAEFQRQQRAWKEAAEEGARALRDAEAKLAAESGARDAAEARVSTLQVGQAE